MSFIRPAWPFLVVLSALPAAAEPAAAAIDAPVVAGPCANCHGPDGHSPGAIPSIAGLPQDELAARLRAFRDESGAAATIMPRLMKGYDDAQIDELASWFSKVPQ